MTERIHVEGHERYPVYDISPEPQFAYEIEVPDGFSARWEAVREEFEACQLLMAEMVRGEPDPVPLPEPTDFVLDVDAGEALHFKPGDTVHMGDENMLVVSIDGGRVRMRKAVTA